jgi:transposase InsO family protein
MVVEAAREEVHQCMKKQPHSSVDEPALIRHSAVSWIQTAIGQGQTLSRALALAGELEWGGRHYSPRTLEGWLYEWRERGFCALARATRSDKGGSRALGPGEIEALVKLRVAHPSLPVTVLVRQLIGEGALPAGAFSLPSVYRALRRAGLDRPGLIAAQAAPHGPTKAFETELANDLWMSDVMDGPTLPAAAAGGGAVHTFLFAVIDDCSRLVPHAEYYDNEKLRCLLDCLRQAFRRRGLPQKFYTDHGKIFTSHHLRVVCANLNIKLLHARPYAAWSKGKIERFFRTVQQDFQAGLRLQPVADLTALNLRFSQWLEGEYHRRAHSALGGQTPQQRFAERGGARRLLPAESDWTALFLARTTRRVRLDATISLEGRLWEVPVHLRGRNVDLRYDPFEWVRVEVWHRDTLAGLARPCDKQLNAKTYTCADYER